MADENIKFVAFNKYCEICKHKEIKDSMNPDIGTYDEDGWSGADAGDEYYPCCDCLEIGARYGTEVPEEYEEDV